MFTADEMDRRLFMGIEISTQQVFAECLFYSALTTCSLCVVCYGTALWQSHVMYIGLFFPQRSMSPIRRRTPDVSPQDVSPLVLRF